MLDVGFVVVFVDGGVNVVRFVFGPGLGLVVVEGSEGGLRARVFRLADAGTLAPAACSGSPGGLEGCQDSGQDEEEEELRGGPRVPTTGRSPSSRPREPQGGA